MLGVEKGTAEEFYSRCLGNAQVLERSARAHALGGRPVPALAAAWGADINTLQAVIWERILVASRTPQRQFFRVAGAIASALREATPTVGDSEAPGDRVRSARARMAVSFDPALASEMQRRWPDLSYLASLPALTEQDVREAAAERLRGLSPARFVARCRADAADAMLEAQSRRIRGEIEAAVQGAYQSDFTSLDAYLVESAVAAGDQALFTVFARWELATHAMTELPGLPDDFSGAVAVIRTALATSLGEADGARLLESLPAV
jgi:hypothetical protein